ncbi:iq-domain [Orobanche hederae]
MGRATKWLKGLFGIKSKEKYETKYSVQPKDRNWNISVLCNNLTTIIPPNITPAEAAWLRSFYFEPDDQLKQHARAIAAATAAAADAAMAAAQAAVAMVHLTSHGSGAATFGGRLEMLAAAKIQMAFRGYLCPKSTSGFEGTGEDSGTSEGIFGRKQAAATLHSMQALIRAQESVRALRAGRLLDKDDNFPFQYQSQESLETFEEHSAGSLKYSRRLSLSTTNAWDEIPSIVEDDLGCKSDSRSKRANDWIKVSCYDSSSAKAISSPFPTLGISRSESNSSPLSMVKSMPRFAAPPKSVYPNYIINKHRFIAKQRSQSALKQRP